MTEGAEISGRCLCGAVTVTAEVEKPNLRACHCDMCRRHTSGMFISVATVPGSVRASGPAKTFRSSDWAERGFCSRCGSNLFYHLKGGEGYVLCLGAFADESAFELAGEIYVDKKPPGYSFAGEHPRQTGAEFMASLGMSEE